MKNLKLSFLMFFSFFLSQFSYAQRSNIGLGYNVGAHISNKGLNYVLDRYNETRSYLSTKMGKPSIYRGMTFYMDIYFSKRIIDFDLTYNKSYCFAEDVDNSNSKVHRDIKFRTASWAMGYGKKLISKDKAMGVYLGADWNFLFLKVYTRKYTIGQKILEYDKVSNDINLGFTPYLQWVGNRFSTKAYLRVMMFNNDYYWLNYYINPNTATSDSDQSTKGRLVSLGFALRYNLFQNKKM